MNNVMTITLWQREASYQKLGKKSIKKGQLLKVELPLICPSSQSVHELAKYCQYPLQLANQLVTVAS